jgi:hypothetical protein
MMAIVVAVVMVPQAERAPNAADDTAGHTTDHATNRPADRTSRAFTSPLTSRRASFTAPHDALGLHGERHSEASEHASSH